MKKEDIEKIMDTSYQYLKEKAPNLALIDMCDITCKIWDDIDKINEDLKKEYFVIDIHQLNRFTQTGNMLFTTKNGLDIEWVYSPFLYKLESGSTLPHWKLPQEQEEMLEYFFEESTSIEPDDSLPLLDYGQKDRDMTSWMLDHLDAIRDVVDFEIKDVKTGETISDPEGFPEGFPEVIDVDIYGRDSNGDLVIITGDRCESTHRGLIWLISTAILVDAKKAIFVANEIHTNHQIIVKWLNEYFSSRIEFFLVEAKRTIINEDIPVATSFELIESPETGWMDND